MSIHQLLLSATFYIYFRISLPTNFFFSDLQRLWQYNGLCSIMNTELVWEQKLHKTFPMKLQQSHVIRILKKTLSMGTPGCSRSSLATVDHLLVPHNGCFLRSMWRSPAQNPAGEDDAVPNFANDCSARCCTCSEDPRKAKWEVCSKCCTLWRVFSFLSVTFHDPKQIQ